jgi:DNA-binding NarL/FixJ family response regulator
VQVEETTPLNVVIVDDHVALRRGMELLLRRAGHHVVGTADDAEAGGALILRRRPDVALVDLALPGMSGAELTRSLLKEDPDLRIVLYTGAADERQLLDALDAGAAGFALKSGDPQELEEAIRTVATGGDYIDPRLTPLLANGGNGRTKRLSPREREILGLLSQGLSGEEVARSSTSPPRPSARTCETRWASSARQPAPTPSRWPSSTARSRRRSLSSCTRRGSTFVRSAYVRSQSRWAPPISPPRPIRANPPRGGDAKPEASPRKVEAAQLPDPLPRRNESNG